MPQEVYATESRFIQNMFGEFDPSLHVFLLLTRTNSIYRHLMESGMSFLSRPDAKIREMAVAVGVLNKVPFRPIGGGRVNL